MLQPLQTSQFQEQSHVNGTFFNVSDLPEYLEKVVEAMLHPESSNTAMLTKIGRTRNTSAGLQRWP